MIDMNNNRETRLQFQGKFQSLNKTIGFAKCALLSQVKRNDLLFKFPQTEHCSVFISLNTLWSLKCQTSYNFSQLIISLSILKLLILCYDPQCVVLFMLLYLVIILLQYVEDVFPIQSQ